MKIKGMLSMMAVYIILEVTTTNIFLLKYDFDAYFRLGLGKGYNSHTRARNRKKFLYC